LGGFTRLIAYMDVRPGRFLSGVLLALLWVGPQPASVEQSAHPFSPGETLTYDVTWSVFRAGEVTATLRSVNEGPHDAYEAITTARSQGFVSLLFDVQNEFRSLFDPQTLCSSRITKKINEGRRHKDTSIVFDRVRKLAILDEHDLTKPGAPPKHTENDIPACVEDVVTAFYYLRRQQFELGHSIKLPVNDGSKTHEVTVEVQAREKIQTPLGDMEAFRVEPKVFSGLFKRKGRMLIWFSADERHLPLRIKAMIAVGSITGTLRAVTEQPASQSAPKAANRIGAAAP
jgi:hypothetical protein